MQTSKRLEAFQLSVILGMFGASAALWTRAPVRMPVHWDLAGEPDRYAGKFEGMLVTPLVALALYGLMLLLPWIDPRRRAYEAFARGYQIIRVAMIVFCAAIHATILLVAFGYRVDVPLVISVGVGILFCILGNFMGKFRPNWFVGGANALDLVERSELEQDQPTGRPAVHAHWRGDVPTGGAAHRLDAGDCAGTRCPDGDLAAALFVSDLASRPSTCDERRRAHLTHATKSTTHASIGC
jgi:uncharacterized membrane protein